MIIGEQIEKLKTCNTNHPFLIHDLICKIFGPVNAKARLWGELCSSFPTAEETYF